MLVYNRSVKQYVIRLGLLVLLAVVVVWFYHLLTMGTLTVSTPGIDDTVAITPIKNGAKVDKLERQAQHFLSASVTPGEYEVSAFNRSGGTSRSITIRARQRLNFNLTLPSTSTLEPVYSDTVSGVVADSSRLTFLGSDNVLTTIDSTEIITKTAADIPLFGAKWVSQGLGIAHDANNNLYILNGGTLSMVPLPFATSPSKPVVYDLSSTGRVYASQGGDLYVGTASGNFKKLASSREIILALSVDNDRIAAAVGQMRPDPEGTLVVFDEQGNVVGHNNVSATQVAWSSNGSYLLAGSDSGFSIFNRSLGQIATLPASVSSGYAWRGNKLFYGQGGSVWAFSTTSLQSYKLADTAGQGAVEGIYPSLSGDYVYITAQVANAGGTSTAATQLFRIGLWNQHVNSSVAALGVLFPTTINDCVYSYINFRQPTIVVDAPSQSAQQSCIDSIKNQMETDSIDVSAFQYKFNQISGGD